MAKLVYDFASKVVFAYQTAPSFGLSIPDNVKLWVWVIPTPEAGPFLIAVNGGNFAKVITHRGQRHGVRKVAAMESERAE